MRTLVDDLAPDVGEVAVRHVDTVLLDRMSLRVRTQGPRRRGDAPRIGERAATRWRITTEGGDERAGVKRASHIRAPAS
jgi:hypothetical protein